MRHKGSVKLRPTCIGTIRARTQCWSINQAVIICVSNPKCVIDNFWNQFLFMKQCELEPHKHLRIVASCTYLITSVYSWALQYGFSVSSILIITILLFSWPWLFLLCCIMVSGGKYMLATFWYLLLGLTNFVCHSRHVLFVGSHITLLRVFRRIVCHSSCIVV